MKHFLLVYDRQRGKLLEQQEFGDRRSAVSGRFAAERTYRGCEDVEVVVLGARSVDALAKTHARYFKSVKELASSALE